MIRFVVALVTAALAAPAVALSQDPGSATISLSDPPAYTSGFIGIPSVGYTTGSCESGKMAVGLAGSRLKFIMNVTLLCASLNKDGSFAGITAVNPGAIGTGGSGFTLQCASGHVMMQVRVAYQTNTTTYPYLGGVQIGCSSWMLSVWNWPAPSQVVATTGFDGWPVKALVKCTRQSQPVRALRVRRTTAVKGLSIICDE